MKLRQLGAFVTALLLLLIPQASANELLTTDPLGGSTIQVSPSVVTITTSLPLLADGNSVEVTDPSGIRVDDGTLAIVENEAVVGLTELTVGGYYTVRYLLLAENDIPLEGSFRFNYSAPAAVSSESASPITTEVTTSEQPSASSSKGTDFLVIMLLVISIFVLVGLGLYARRIFNER